MFKNRSIQVSLAKTDPAAPDAPRQIDRDAIVFWNSVAVSNAERLGTGLIAMYAIKKAIDTVSIVIIKSTPLR